MVEFNPSPTHLIAGIVLFTFLHFNETPAIVTSVVIGLGIVFCGGAVIHNVFIWQRVSDDDGDGDGDGHDDDGRG